MPLPPQENGAKQNMVKQNDPRRSTTSCLVLRPLPRTQGPSEPGFRGGVAPPTHWRSANREIDLSASRVIWVHDSWERGRLENLARRYLDSVHPANKALAKCNVGIWMYLEAFCGTTDRLIFGTTGSGEILAPGVQGFALQTKHQRSAENQAFKLHTLSIPLMLCSGQCDHPCNP